MPIPKTCSTISTIPPTFKEILQNPYTISKTGFYERMMITLVRQYVASCDENSRMVYLHYLVFKDFKKSACILNISEKEVCSLFHAFISKFHEFAVNQLKKGNIDIEETHYYVKYMQEKELDDQEIACYFDENMLTTKVIKNFLRHANVIS